MQLEILDARQHQILSHLAFTKRRFCLVGGTALALQLGHRRSIDFDFFTDKKLSLAVIDNNLSRKLIDEVVLKTAENYTLFYDGVKITFCYYPFDLTRYKIPLAKHFIGVDPVTIGAMMAYALGRRSK